MTIAQRFVEMGEQMGIDTSECKTGNIGEVLNALTQNVGGEVSDSQNIQMAMMNFFTGLRNAMDSQNDDDQNDNQNHTKPESGSPIGDSTDNTNTTEPTNSTEGSGW